MRQRLAEVMELLISCPGQLKEKNAFSSDLKSSQESTPRLQPKRKDAA